MSQPIERFIGEYAWLSNFWPCEVELDGEKFAAVEFAYQAAKTDNLAAREKIRLTRLPNEAKKLGGKVKLRKDWEEKKLEIMELLLRQKFGQPHFQQLLRKTGDRELVEGNYWKDFYWGVCNGEGENHLGKLLMKIRSEL